MPASRRSIPRAAARSRRSTFPVICAGVRVCTGDLVFGDADGVVVIPQAVEAEVLRIAFDKIASEDSSMDDLRNGAYLRDVYERHGVL